MATYLPNEEAFDSLCVAALDGIFGAATAAADFLGQLVHDTAGGRKYFTNLYTYIHTYNMLNIYITVHAYIHIVIAN